jgi:hypothetical protein
MEYAHNLADRFWPARDHGMTTRRASELTLAADFSCSGTFSAVGVIREPTLALSVAIRDLLLYREDPELKPVVIHVLATRVAGRCSIRSANIRRALLESMASRVALEWKVTIPTMGAVRALFVVTRLGKTGEADLFDLVLHLASKPSFEDAQTQEAPPPPPRRASSLLRIF